MERNYLRDIYVFGSDFWSFYHLQPNKVQDKFDWVIDLVRTLKLIPERFFKHLEGAQGLFEIRVKVGSNIFRLFCFFDRDLVVLLNAFHKKSQKTPTKEILKAKRLRRQYYEEKRK